MLSKWPLAASFIVLPGGECFGSAFVVIMLLVHIGPKQQMQDFLCNHVIKRNTYLMQKGGHIN